MASPSDPRREYEGTYFVLDRSNKDELTRLMIQDRMLTAGMGGVLPEQPHPETFHRVLDVGCGTGAWLIQAAKTYPGISQLMGVDIGPQIIAYARVQAQAEQVHERVEFHIMNALLTLEFPTEYMDLANIRLGGSFLRTWEWPKLLQELCRVTRKGGIIRVVESDIVGESNSPALNRVSQLLAEAFHQAGYFFTPEHNGLINRLPDMVQRVGLKNIQTHLHKLVFQAGTSKGQHFAEDMNHAFKNIAPFLRKWGCLPSDYPLICQQAQQEMDSPGFEAIWGLLVIWGNNTPW